MTTLVGADEQLRSFLALSAYALQGGIVTDLDGTVVHEERGHVRIPAAVSLGLKQLYEAGHPLILNTLRFPLSVMRTFGAEWYGLSNAPIPAITLNGSQLGFVTRDSRGELGFEEITAFPLVAAEISEALIVVRELLADDVRDILLFHYPRDWRLGEMIWTPSAERIQHVKEKYPSASAVSAVTLDKLEDELLREPQCMLFLLVDIPADRRMAYQHTRRHNFVTHQGVDKLSGAKYLAQHLGIDLSHSLGAGDTEMDNFLSGVGLAVVVGSLDLPFRGLLQTIRLENASQFGELLFRLAAVQRRKSP